MADSARSLGLRVEEAIEMVDVLGTITVVLEIPATWHRTNSHKPDKIHPEPEDKFGISNSAVIFEGAIAAWLAGVPHIWHVHEVLKSGNVTAPILPLTWIKRIIRSISASVIFESNTSRKFASQIIVMNMERLFITEFD